MDNLLRILDRFPETLNALPGAPGSQHVSAGSAGSLKGGAVEAVMVHESGEEYEGKR